MSVSHTDVSSTQRWLTELAKDYRGEIPTRIHASAHGQHFGLGSAPPFAPEFERYLSDLRCQNPHCKRCREDIPVYIEGGDSRDRKKSQKTRVTNAYRKLRRVSPVEYDVVIMATKYGLTANEIAERLNDRAIRRGHPERYDIQTVMVLAVLGVDKIGKWLVGT